MISFLKTMRRDTRGTTTIEYGILCGMIVLAIIGAVRNLGSENGGLWGGINTKATAAMSSSG